MTDPFAVALDAGTGDVRLDSDYPHRWAAGSPMAEVVARVVRTPRGAYAPDPSFGVDYAAVEKAAPAQRPAALRAAVTAALQRWTSRRLLTALAIEVDPPAAGRLVFRVVFRDPRSSDPGLSRVAGSL